MITEAERLDVEKVIHDAIGWALNKNIDRLFSIMAQDDDFFIFHPDSKSMIIGFEAFKGLGERVWMKDAFKAMDFSVKDLRLKFSELGNVAWYSCILDDHAEWNGQPIVGTMPAGQEHWKSAAANGLWFKCTSHSRRMINVFLCDPSRSSQLIDL